MFMTFNHGMRTCHDTAISIELGLILMLGCFMALLRPHRPGVEVSHHSWNRENTKQSAITYIQKYVLGHNARDCPLLESNGDLLRLLGV